MDTSKSECCEASTTFVEEFLVCKKCYEVILSV